VQPTNIFDLAFFVKVVDVFDAIERQEDAEFSTLLALLLLSGGTQASSATQPSSATSGISLGDPLTLFLLFQSFFPHFRKSDFLPLFAVILGTQGSGTQGTQVNLLLPLLLLASQSGPQRPHFWEIIGRKEFAELMEKIQEQQGSGTSGSVSNLLAATTEFLQSKTED
jgi:hypothetical protein